MANKLIKLLCLALFLVVANSCKKDPVNPAENETPAKATITADETNVKNMQAVLLTVANKKVDAAYYDAKLGTDSVKLVKVADDQLVFIVPEKTAAGSYTLHVPALAENTVVFHVSEIAAITNPDKYLQDFIAQINGMQTEMLNQIDSLSKDTLVNKSEMLAISKANKDSLAATIAKIQSASAEEKKYAALFIEANRKAIDDINTSLEDLRMGKRGLLNNKTHFKKSHCNDYEHFGKMRCLLREFVIAIAKMSTPAVLGGFTGGALSAWYTGGAFSTGGAQAGAILGTFLFKDFVAAQMNLAVSRALEFAAEPFIMVKDKLGDFSSRGKNIMEFENGKERKVRFTVTMRNVDERVDATSEHDFVVSFLQSFKKLQNMWISFYPDANTVLTLPTPKKRSIEPKKMEHMSIKILNNSKVTGKLSGTPTDLKITFSTEDITEQEFTFELNYNDGFYTNKATQEALLKGKTYKVLTSKFETIYILAIFEHNKAQTFYLSEDEKTPAQNVEYSKISIRNQVNNKVEIILTKNTSSFTINMKHDETDDQFVFFDVFYGETKVQEISAKLVKNNYSLTLTSGDNQNALFDESPNDPIVFKLTNTHPNSVVAGQKIKLTSSTSEDGILNTWETTVGNDGTISVNNWILNGKGAGRYSIHSGTDDDQTHMLEATYTTAEGKEISVSANAVASVLSGNTWGKSAHIKASVSLESCGQCSGYYKPMKIVVTPSGGIGEYATDAAMTCKTLGASKTVNGVYTSDCVDAASCTYDGCNTKVTGWVVIIDKRGAWNQIDF